MEQLDTSLKVLDGLQKDPTGEDYRVLPGYSQQVMRYPIHQTWLDENDEFWISGEAVKQQLQSEAETPNHR